jgi:hypothetical protein
MKRFLLIILLIVTVRAPVKAEPPADTSRPLIPLRYLSQEEFGNHGLRFWEADDAHDAAPKPTNIAVNYLKGGDDTSPTRRTMIYVGAIGQSLPIYCVSGTSERDVVLILQAFLEGYIAAQNR